MLVVDYCCFFFFKQKTAYEMRISDWSSDVCSSDLPLHHSLSASGPPPHGFATGRIGNGRSPPQNCVSLLRGKGLPRQCPAAAGPPCALPDFEEIGRASCRERVCQYV